MFRKSLLCIALFTSASANSTVCTDPTGLGQMISQSAQDAMIWAEEKGMELSKITLDELIAQWKDSKDTVRTLGQTQTLSNTASETANLEQQAKMEPSPLMCDGINSLMGIYESLDDFYCETSDQAIDFAGQLAQVVNCTDGRCDTPEQNIADEAVKLFEEDIVTAGAPDMAKMTVTGAIPGMSEGGYSKSREEKERTDVLLKVMFNPGDVRPMPTEANGDMITSESSPEMIRNFLRWQRQFLRTTTGYTTALRVNAMSDPVEQNGVDTKSLLEQIKNDIDRYNTPEQIKLIGNGGDKSCFRAKQSYLKTQEEMDLWLESPDGIKCKSQFTTIEQVQRIDAQLTTRIANLMSLIYDSQLNSEFNLGLQTQIMNELLNKRGM